MLRYNYGDTKGDVLPIKQFYFIFDSTNIKMFVSGSSCDMDRIILLCLHTVKVKYIAQFLGSTLNNRGIHVES